VHIDSGALVKYQTSNDEGDQMLLLVFSCLPAYLDSHLHLYYYAYNIIHTVYAKMVIVICICEDKPVGLCICMLQGAEM